MFFYPSITGKELSNAFMMHLNEMDIEITDKMVSSVISFGGIGFISGEEIKLLRQLGKVNYLVKETRIGGYYGDFFVFVQPAVAGGAIAYA